jgi:hypothetical protein
MTTTLTDRSLEVFLLYAEDAVWWSGMPFVLLSNVSFTDDMKGNLSDLVKKGLIEIDNRFDNDSHIEFTAKGKELATEHGIDVTLWER